MGRDVIFERIAPATYALQSIRSHYKELKIERKDMVEEEEDEDEDEPAKTESPQSKDDKGEPEIAEKERLEEEEAEEAARKVRTISFQNIHLFMDIKLT